MKPRAHPPAISDSDFEHLAAFRHALREFLHFSEEAALAAGVSPQQHQALLAIKGHGSRLTVGDLAGLLMIKHHSAVGLVNRMEADGLIVKNEGREDRRQVFLRISARGLRLLAKLSPAHKAELARIGPALRRILTQLEGSA
ncbi:MAG TPA: MarR family transcriptional regulator [Chthoniobacteraceae bacterium]|jgi:DNA-binding MarR family transcriptional regulator|nr:MarR family transcriptional regulator [Chthoniobacteraceae bacterium]